MFLDEIGTSVCHQVVSRSFNLGGLILPVCARCTGIYLGAFVSYIYYLVSNKRKASELPPNKIIYILIAYILLMGLDVGTVLIDLREETNNYLRLFTGLITGGAVVSFLYPISNFILWKSPDKSEIISDYKDLGFFTLFLLVFYYPVSACLSWFYWPAAVMSILGILFLYFNVNLILMTMFMKKDHKTERIKDLLPAVPGAIVLALIELYLLRLYHIWIRT